MALSNPFAESAPPFWSGGPGPSGYHDFPNRSQSGSMSSATAGPVSHSQYPITTGTSVFGLKYKDGIIIAADTSGNYGNLARYPTTQRVHKVNETTVIASSGDIADFQYLHRIIKSKQNEEDIRGGGVTMRPEALHCWLTRVLYNRRSKFDPLWNSIIVGGIQDGKPFLGCVDYIGTAWKENAVATGMGAAMAIPIINHELEKYDNSTDNLNFEQARDIMMKCLRVSYLRDCRATNKFHISVVNKDGAKVEGPLTIDSNWEVAKLIKGYD